ncbi:DUF5995 family protein [Rhodococcus sp. HM1]|uniref:DUF5995 family protein n=1 Tax=Rhodococcus sp. HM1 TaxID=2937759 RepID=UPI002009EF50|nr:DUF5995 family protein [Rhodococcus sp. HM1]MCK8675008.1 DUF5995 family protein [Rhodococcus sp. HM1]
MHAHDLDDVVDILDAIVADTIATANPRGYFAAMYRQVALEVAAASSPAIATTAPG